MILLDYSQIAIGAIFSMQKEFNSSSEEKKVNIIRNVILSTIKYYKKAYSKKYGELVIACDGKDYWRKQLFPHYKAARKKNRENSDMDWDFIFRVLNTIRDELRDNFPYKVIHLDEIEADDIIATLVNETAEFGNFQENMIISSDKDFKQLHKLGNVKQFSPILKKLIKAESAKALAEARIEHIVKGDKGDGIPNIFSADDVFVSGGRQTPVSTKRLLEFFEMGANACRSDDERRNWDRNCQLIDFDRIPQRIRDTILNSYETQKPKGDKMSIMNYLIKHKCRLLLDELEDF